MRYERYENMIISPDKLEFRFTSEGPKGNIEKIVQFTRLLNGAIYNLAFGNLFENGQIDDKTTNDNKDRNKILATVATAVYEFSSEYPDKFIFFNGSTPQRTRLYRMALTINLYELKRDFLIYGVVISTNGFKRVVFRKGEDYFGFMIKRKKRKFTI